MAATDSLSRFDRPVLVAWASEDSLMPREHGRRLAELFPEGRLIEIDNSYTLVPEDQPDLLADRMLEFLRS
jgi:pimeloyl-ACP methyl ester carboxylesterase